MTKSSRPPFHFFFVQIYLNNKSYQIDSLASSIRTIITKKKQLNLDKREFNTHLSKMSCINDHFIKFDVKFITFIPDAAAATYVSLFTGGHSPLSLYFRRRHIK